MGIKSGRFTGRNGHEYEVALVGATVATATIDLGIPPATISMAAGEHKFCGFKSTTAMVNILTDVPLIELYSAGVTDIRLTIEDVTDDKVEFDGYVTPFAFDQPYTGKNDSVTVNAVDLLTARKDVKYENITTDNEREYGTDRYAIDIIASLAHSAGIETIVEHINFDVTTTSPLRVKVAQAGFLQDEVCELDALSAICKFFGMTACCVGRTLYLYDEHCLLNANQGHSINANVYDISDGRAVRTAQYYDSQDTPLSDQVLMSTDAVHNDISVTIERAYDGIQITPEGSDTSVLLPDVCADENMEELNYDDGINSYRMESNDDRIAYRIPMSSKVMNTGRAGTSDVSNLFSVNGRDYMTEGDPNQGAYWRDGSVLMRYVNIRKSTITLDDNEIEVIDTPSLRNLLWVRYRTVSPSSDPIVALLQKEGHRYSHTGGYIRIRARFFMYYPNTSSSYMPPEDENRDTSEWRMPWAQVICGEKCLKRVSVRSLEHDWADSLFSVSPLVALSDDKGLAPSLLAVSHYDNSYVVDVPTSGQIYMRFAKIYEQGARDFFFEELSIEAVGENVNTEHPDMRHVFGDDDEEMLGVGTILTSRNSGVVGQLTDTGVKPYGVNARPSVVPASYWNGGYMGRSDSESIPISGILMEQLKARYAQPRICYKMTVEKNINPYAAVYFGGKGYTVEAYDKDLYNSTTTITID